MIEDLALGERHLPTVKFQNEQKVQYYTSIQGTIVPRIIRNKEL